MARQDDNMPLTEEWMSSVGFDRRDDFSLGMERSVKSGDDSWLARLRCEDIANLGDTVWTIGSMVGASSEWEMSIIPADPSTRGELRALCNGIGMPLKEGK